MQAQDSFADEDLMRRVVRQLCQQVGELDDKEEEGSRRLVGFCKYMYGCDQCCSCSSC